MVSRAAVFLATLLAASLAIPTPRHAFSDLFIHAEAGSRVVGGTTAPEGSVPYMVAMTSGLLVRSFICGGSLISTKHVLTAAHCIDIVYKDGVLSGQSMGPLSDVLMELVTTTVGSEQCVREVAEVSAQIDMPVPPVDPHTMLCVFHSAERAMCGGDSGSALVNVNNNLQIGIVSWGLSCARGAPDIYVRLSTYKDWIASVTA